MAIALLCLGCLLLPQSGEPILRLDEDRIHVTDRRPGAVDVRIAAQGVVGFSGEVRERNHVAVVRTAEETAADRRRYLVHESRGSHLCRFVNGRPTMARGLGW